MKINILQSDIDNGKCGNIISCPIALAVKRQDVMVHMNYIYIGSIKYDLTMPARVFINDFDVGNHVNPGELEIFDEPPRVPDVS